MVNLKFILRKKQYLYGTEFTAGVFVVNKTTNKDRNK